MLAEKKSYRKYFKSKRTGPKHYLGQATQESIKFYASDGH
jgi:hypothetical protein